MNNRMYAILRVVKQVQLKISGMGHVIFQGAAAECLGGNQKN
jgi:sorbitol-specific phosphotransferase system component IIA